MNKLKCDCYLRLMLALAVVAAWVGVVSAEPPEVAPRYFAELAAANSCTDWEAEGSRRMVAHRDGATAQVIEFATVDFLTVFPSDVTIHDGDGNVILDLEGTTWVRMPVVHFTDAGVEEVREVYWLQEEGAEPGVGLTSATGPDGDVVVLTSFNILRLSSGNAENSDKFILTDGVGFGRLCLSVGLFQR